MTVKLRLEHAGDEAAVRAVNVRAFGRNAEADVVDALRIGCPEGISLVAERDGGIVGHILFTPARIEGGGKEAQGMALGPMAVLPEHQGRGIGSELVRAGLADLRTRGVPFVIVVGHPWFYPKFGFLQASGYGIRCEYEGVPEEAFMIAVFDPAQLRGVHGTVKERPEFFSAM